MTAEQIYKKHFNAQDRLVQSLTGEDKQAVAAITEALNVGKEERERLEEENKRLKEVLEAAVIKAYQQGCKDTYGIDEPSDSDPDDYKEAKYYYTKNFTNE